MASVLLRIKPPGIDSGLYYVVDGTKFDSLKSAVAYWIEIGTKQADLCAYGVISGKLVARMYHLFGEWFFA
jgi:hypothetical protein